MIEQFEHSNVIGHNSLQSFSVGCNAWHCDLWLRQFDSATSTTKAVALEYLLQRCADKQYVLELLNSGVLGTVGAVLALPQCPDEHRHLALRILARAMNSFEVRSWITETDLLSFAKSSTVYLVAQTPSQRHMSRLTLSLLCKAATYPELATSLFRLGVWVNVVELMNSCMTGSKLEDSELSILSLGFSLLTSMIKKCSREYSECLVSHLLIHWQNSVICRHLSYIRGEGLSNIPKVRSTCLGVRSTCLRAACGLYSSICEQTRARDRLCSDGLVFDSAVRLAEQILKSDAHPFQLGGQEILKLISLLCMSSLTSSRLVKHDSAPNAIASSSSAISGSSSATTGAPSILETLMALVDILADRSASLGHDLKSSECQTAVASLTVLLSGLSSLAKNRAIQFLINASFSESRREALKRVQGPKEYVVALNTFLSQITHRT